MRGEEQNREEGEMAQKVGRRDKLAQEVGRREIYSPLPSPSSITKDSQIIL